MTFAKKDLVPGRRWESWAGRLVACRHPLLLAFALLFTWSYRSSSDWKLLSLGGQRLFSSSALSVYAKTSGLQAGPPSLVVVRGLNLFPGNTGELLAHVLLAFLGWYLIYLVERWTVTGATWRAAPLGAGLLTLAVGLPVLQEWAWLAGDTPHIEDALAIVTFLVAVRAIVSRRELWGALLIGLAISWKPWAIAALPLVYGCSRRCKALLIAVAVPAACWLPFLIGDHGTLSAVGNGVALQQNSMLHVLGLFGGAIPHWWRSAELAAVLAGAALAVRRDWRCAFAAGCAMRMLLDPAGYAYYYAGLIMVTALTERLVGARPWRTAVLWLAVGYVPLVGAEHGGNVVLFTALTVVYLSWAQPWPHGSGARGRAVGHLAAAPELVPVQAGAGRARSPEPAGDRTIKTQKAPM